MANFYLDEKQKQKKRRLIKLKTYAAIGLFVVLAAAIFYLFFFSAVFKIKNIYITDIPEKDKIKMDLEDFLVNNSQLSKFLGNDNILIWRNDTKEFIKKYPDIDSLSVERNFFKREIKIEVVKKEKFGVWCANACWWFDKKGIIFEEAPQIEGGSIKTVYDLSNKEIKLGDYVLPRNFLDNFFKIISIIERADLRAKNLIIEDIELQEITADIFSGPKIYFSLRIDSEFSLSALESFKNTGLDKIQYIDLRVENRAYYKLK